MSESLKNKLLVKVIRYSPPVLIIFLFIIISFSLFYNYTKELNNNRTTFKESLIKNNKEKLKSHIFTTTNYIEKEFQKTEQALKEELKQEVEIAHNMVTSIYNKYKDIKSREEIIKIIYTVLKDIRFNDGRGYFFINQTDGICILHPIFPSREGKDISKQKDKNGNTRFSFVKDSVLNKDGFSSVQFFHPLNKTKERKKILYGKLFEPYDLIILTGEYLEDFNTDFKKKMISYLENLEYKDNQYMFTIEKDGTLLASYESLLNGQNIFKSENIQLLNGTLEKFMNSSKETEFIQYTIKNNGQDAYEKISFLKKIESLNWIVGMGFNLENVNKQIIEQEKLLEEKYKDDLVTLLIITIAITIVLLLISHYVSNILEEQFFHYQEEMQESYNEIESLNEFLQSILDSTPVMIFWKDKDGKYLGCNKKFLKSTGYNDVEDIKGKTDYEMPWKEKETQKYILDDQEVLKNNKKKLFVEETITNKNGEEQHIVTSKVPLYNKYSKVIGILGIMEDITQNINNQKALQETTRQLYEQEAEKVDNYQQTIVSLVDLIEQRDFYTGGHSYRVADYSVKIARELNFNSQEIFMLKQIALLHDIGKIAIPDSILLKPGRLTDIEHDIIKSHVEIGHSIISKIPMFEKFSDIILYHHERYDGTGYPVGLKGEEIPLLAAVVAVADTFDAMTTTRIYNRKKTVAQALEEIQNQSGISFNPKVVQIATRVLKDVTIQSYKTQLPKTYIEKERFAYYFKDSLTDLSNENYLKLLYEQETQKYENANLFLVHNFSSFNSKYGWEKGNKALYEIAQTLKEEYPSKEIFRFHGVNFVILSETDIEIDLEKISKKVDKPELTFEAKAFYVKEFKNNESLFQHLSQMT